jgi:hypothetical protein
MVVELTAEVSRPTAYQPQAVFVILEALELVDVFVCL